MIAVWESVPASDKKYEAKLTVTHAGLPIVTEIVTALVLNRMSDFLGWEHLGSPA